MFRRTLIAGLIVAALLAAFHFIAVEYYLYWKLWWFDVPMHVIGGMAISTLGLWFFGSLLMRYSIIPDFRAVVLLILLFVFFVGVWWELFENVTGYTFNTIGSYSLDILKDLIMDMIGAVLVLYLYSRSVRTKEIQ